MAMGGARRLLLLTAAAADQEADAQTHAMTKNLEVKRYDSWD